MLVRKNKKGYICRITLLVLLNLGLFNNTAYEAVVNITFNLYILAGLLLSKEGKRSRVGSLTMLNI